MTIFVSLFLLTINNLEIQSTKMNGYTKLFSNIITSTIWQEPNDGKVLWITLLALRDWDNICRATTPALAKMCDMTIEDVEKYLTKFQQPDKYSRSPEFEGRRIERIDGGWLLLNGEKYKQLCRSLERKDYLREKKRESRQRERQHMSTLSTTSTETKTKTKTETKKNKNSVWFDHFWKEYPRKIAKQSALKAWNSLSPDESLVSKITNALDNHKKSDQWTRDNGKFIPYPATWLNQHRWEDEETEIKALTNQERILKALEAA